MSVSLAILVFMHLYDMKPEIEQQLLDEYRLQQTEPLWMHGLPMISSTVQLLEWTAIGLSGLRSHFLDRII
ncbi:hypothetical protein BG015_006825 [Linnemannia schmuckeri]|uniref:Uncharacterized protein n=1 Tax=Linnemannia schmuckeri TaxID=64567 RepID=A0A9P5S216_9FUNG|nr:hypothetical protein BG015_006825 [Linnemannia schmuckeri]